MRTCGAASLNNNASAVRYIILFLQLSVAYVSAIPRRQALNEAYGVSQEEAAIGPKRLPVTSLNTNPF